MPIRILNLVFNPHYIFFSGTGRPRGTPERREWSRRRRERLFGQDEKRRQQPKNEPIPVKNSAIHAGHWRCRFLPMFCRAAAENINYLLQPWSSWYKYQRKAYKTWDKTSLNPTTKGIVFNPAWSSPVRNPNKRLCKRGGQENLFRCCRHSRQKYPARSGSFRASVRWAWN